MAMLLAFSLVPASAFASSNIGLELDGKNIRIENDQRPFIENGVTYVPIRLVSNALGKEVSWDKENRVVHIGKKAKVNNSDKISLEDFIKEYNVYSSGETYGEYIKGFERLEEKYKTSKNLGFKIAGEDVVFENINLTEEIYPIYNELSKVRFSLAVSDNAIDLDGEEVRLEGGAPRIKALVKEGQDYKLKNLVAKLDYEVDENTPNRMEEFEIKLDGVYGLGLPKNAVNVEFYRNKDKVRIYLDGVKFQATNRFGTALEPVNKNSRIYLPIRSVAEEFGKEVSFDKNSRTVVLKDPSDKKLGLSPKEVFESYGAGDYERKIASRIERDSIYMYNPRKSRASKLENMVHIPDGTLKLNGEFKKLRGYHSVGTEIFKLNETSYTYPIYSDKAISARLNTGFITSGEKVIYDANEYFKTSHTGEILELKPTSARLKKYMPSNVVYFEIDLEGLDEITFNNFNAFNLEFVK